MVDPYSTGAACPTKTLSCDDEYVLYPDALYYVREPERPPYGRVVPESARQLARNVRLLRAAGQYEHGGFLFSVICIFFASALVQLFPAGIKV
ncbi:MAG: hypothetical protein GXP23_01475 [Gammaproteobacteria bacterium]|nr:hypothetical protein [Gammaproteobacteria bacterium]